MKMNYTLKYRKELIHYFIKMRIKENKDIKPILKKLVHKGYKDFDFHYIECEIKKYLLSLGALEQDIENLLTELEYY